MNILSNNILGHGEIKVEIDENFANYFLKLKTIA